MSKNQTSFSKTYQPDSVKLRVPKWKAHLRRELKKNYPEISKAIMDACKEGSIKHIEFVRDWLYGKVKEQQEQTHIFTSDTLQELKNIFDQDE